MGEDQIEISLGKDEALVLFELLFDYFDAPALDVPNAAERVALWRLHAALEKILVEPFLPEYGSLLNAARERMSRESQSL